MEDADIKRQAHTAHGLCIHVLNRLDLELKQGSADDTLVWAGLWWTCREASLKTDHEYCFFIQSRNTFY